MDMLRLIDPVLSREVARRREEVWTDLARWLAKGWRRAQHHRSQVEVPILAEEVLIDLAYGRD